MGSSLAPILVQIVLEDVIRATLEKLDFEPDFWCTYVDDHLTSIPKDMINTVLELLNSYHPFVQFTVEVQDQNSSSINFLDVTVHNENGKLDTNWFCKPIASNRLINFYSAHPPKMIENTALSFIKRVLCLSHRKYFRSNIERVKAILGKNNFPPKVVTKLVNVATSGIKPGQENTSYQYLGNSTINSTLHESTIGDTSQNNTSTVPPEPIRYCGITYIKGVSEAISSQIRREIPNLRLANRPWWKASRLYTPTKDKIPMNERSGAVYRIPCRDCEKVYVGETIQKVGVRLKQHKNDEKNGPLNKNPTALVGHTLANGHKFNFDSASILRRENNKKKLQLQEIHHIILEGDAACNFKRDSEFVSPSYYNLVQRSRIRATVEHP